MSSRFHGITRAAALSAMLMLSSQAFAQSDDVDPEIRIQQLENQLRQLTGQNEELQYRNRQLEDRLRLLQGGVQAAPDGQPGAVQPNVAVAPPQPSAQDQYESAARIEKTRPEEAAGLYRQVAAGGTAWAPSALFALGRLEADRGRTASARQILQDYLARYPRGLNADDARALLQRMQ